MIETKALPINSQSNAINDTQLFWSIITNQDFIFPNHFVFRNIRSNHTIKTKDVITKVNLQKSYKIWENYIKCWIGHNTFKCDIIFNGHRLKTVITFTIIEIKIYMANKSPYSKSNINSFHISVRMQCKIHFLYWSFFWLKIFFFSVEIFS